MMEPAEIDNSDFLQALLEGNRGECSKIVHAHLKNQMTVHDLYQKVIVACVEYVKPDLLAISLSIYSNIPVFEKMIQKIREQKPNLPILVGGQAFRRGGQDVIARYPNAKYLPDLNIVDIYIKHFQLNG